MPPSAMSGTRVPDTQRREFAGALFFTHSQPLSHRPTVAQDRKFFHTFQEIMNSSHKYKRKMPGFPLAFSLKPSSLNLPMVSLEEITRIIKTIHTNIKPFLCGDASLSTALSYNSGFLQSVYKQALFHLRDYVAPPLKNSSVRVASRSVINRFPRPQSAPHLAELHRPPPLQRAYSLSGERHLREQFSGELASRTSWHLRGATSVRHRTYLGHDPKCSGIAIPATQVAGDAHIGTRVANAAPSSISHSLFPIHYSLIHHDPSSIPILLSSFFFFT